MNAPSSLEISAARAAAGLTQAEAAGVVYADIRTWQRWEADDRAMHPAIFELFMIKTGQMRVGRKHTVKV
jgi:DNA-binding transcriptional regulator YiaG